MRFGYISVKTVCLVGSRDTSHYPYYTYISYCKEHRQTKPNFLFDLDQNPAKEPHVRLMTLNVSHLKFENLRSTLRQP